MVLENYDLKTGKPIVEQRFGQNRSPAPTKTPKHAAQVAFTEARKGILRQDSLFVPELIEATQTLKGIAEVNAQKDETPQTGGHAVAIDNAEQRVQAATTANETLQGE